MRSASQKTKHKNEKNKTTKKHKKTKTKPPKNQGITSKITQVKKRNTTIPTRKATANPKSIKAS